MFSFVGHISWNAMKKGRRDRDEWSYRNSTLLLGKFTTKSWRGKTLSNKIAVFWAKVWGLSLRVSLLWHKEGFFLACSDCSSCQRSFGRLLFLLYLFYFAFFYLVLFYYLLLLLFFIIQSPEASSKNLTFFHLLSKR